MDQLGLDSVYYLTTKRNDPTVGNEDAEIEIRDNERETDTQGKEIFPFANQILESQTKIHLRPPAAKQFRSQIRAYAFSSSSHICVGRYVLTETERRRILNGVIAAC